MCHFKTFSNITRSMTSGKGKIILNTLITFDRCVVFTWDLHIWKERLKSFRLMYNVLYFDEIQETFMTSTMTWRHNWQISETKVAEISSLNIIKSTLVPQDPIKHFNPKKNVIKFYTHLFKDLSRNAQLAAQLLTIIQLQPLYHWSYSAIFIKFWHRCCTTQMLT